MNEKHFTDAAFAMDVPGSEKPVGEPKQVRMEPRSSQPAYRWTGDSRIVREYK